MCTWDSEDIKGSGIECRICSKQVSISVFQTYTHRVHFQTYNHRVHTADEVMQQRCPLTCTISNQIYDKLLDRMC